MLDRSPDVLTSRDGRYFTAVTARRLLAEIVRSSGGAPLLGRVIASEFNFRLAEHSHRTRAFVSRQLRLTPEVAVAPDGYRFAGEAAGPLPQDHETA